MTREEFKRFHEANIARLGEVFSSLGNWTQDEWIACLAGEVGELINCAKKLRRFDSGMTDGTTRQEILASIGRELGDCVAYVSLIGHATGLDTEEIYAPLSIMWDGRRAESIRKEGFSSLMVLVDMVRRVWVGNMSLEDVMEELFATASAYGLDLNEWTVKKFNEVSVKRGSKIFL